MAATQESDKLPADTPMERTAMHAFIGRQVLQSLGSPGDLLKVQVNPLGNDHYRVNVMVGKSLASARVGDSFFLTAEATWAISSPPRRRSFD